MTWLLAPATASILLSLHIVMSWIAKGSSSPFRLFACFDFSNIFAVLTLYNTWSITEEVKEEQTHVKERRLQNSTARLVVDCYDFNIRSSIIVHFLQPVAAFRPPFGRIIRRFISILDTLCVLAVHLPSLFPELIWKSTMTVSFRQLGPSFGIVGPLLQEKLSPALRLVYVVFKCFFSFWVGFLLRLRSAIEYFIEFSPL